MIKTVITMELRYEQDIVLCRQRVRQVAELLSFDRQDQTRIATAVSEIVRNAFEYAGGGRIEIGIEDQAPQAFLITIRDSGPGIQDLRKILDGQYVSKTGMGLGILGAKRLMERFEIDSQPGKGTKIILGKYLPNAAVPLTVNRLGKITDELTKKGPQNPFQEVQQQNQELLRALDELQVRQTELARLNLELEETNRGVVALYAELDEKAESLKRASEAKTSFLSHMTHEFRTPLNSIMGLSRAALSEDDGALNLEHKKQITYIQKSAEALSELVNDLLDIAKVEAGKVDIRPSSFAVSELLGGLRGVLKPLAVARPEVSLIFHPPKQDLILYADEGKLSQVLRNLISNALKYTECGEVTVTAEAEKNGMIRFSVADTGIGIALQDQERIFDEFIQIESRLQKHSKGTGLGLSLSRKLATLMGGSLSVKSGIGQGSVFTFVLPTHYESKKIESPRIDLGLLDTSTGVAKLKQSTGLSKILIIDDEEISRYLLKELIPTSELTLLEASDGFEGVRLASSEQPKVIFLDLQMPAMSGFYVLQLLKSNPFTKAIPVVVHTAMTLSEEERKKLDRDVIAIIPKAAPSRDVAKAWVRDALSKAHLGLNLDSKEAELA